MAPPKFENRRQAVNHILSYAEEIAGNYEVITKAQNLILSNMLSGVSYTDPETDEEKTTPDLSAATPGNIATANSLVGSVLKKGEKSLNEVTRGGSACQFMMLFCRSKGFSTDDIIELGSHPDSLRSKALLKQIGSFKQEYCDMINSNDTGKITDFLLTPMDRFQKELPDLLKCGNIEGLAKNFKQFLSWSIGGAIQQSLGNANNVSTPEQTTIIRGMNEKLRAKYGPGFDLHCMLGYLQPFHTASSLLENKLSSKPALEVFKNSEDYKAKTIEMLSNVMRPIKMTNLEIEKLRGMGENVPPFSVKPAKACAIGATTLATSYDFTNSSIVTDEIRLYAGDPTGRLFCNIEHMDDYTFDGSDGRTALSTMPVQGDYWRFFSDEYIMADLEDPDAFNQRMQEKREAGQDMANSEIAVLLHPDSTALSPKERETLNIFMNGPQVARSGLRMSGMSDMLRHAVTSVAHIDCNAEPDELISGAAIMRRGLRNNFFKVQNAIEQDCVTAPMDIGFQKKTTQLLGKMLSTAPVTIASSKEFKDLDKAFKDLEAMTPAQIKNQQEVYAEKLRALQAASDAYITAKNADGKPERSTAKGQIRLNLAKNMKTFAEESLAGLNRNREALANAPTALVKNSDAPGLKLNNAISARVNGFFGREPTGDRECVTKGIYKEENYAPAQINYPENTRFSDREIAIIGLAGLTKGENLRTMSVHNDLLTEPENGVRLFTHTVSDAIVHLRASPLSEEAVGCFDNARRNGADCIRAFENGNTAPLAQLLGQGIKAINQACITDTISDDIVSNMAIGQEMMGLLRKHPEMVAQSGLTSADIAKFRSVEKACHCVERGKEAVKALQENPDLAPEEKKQLISEVLASAFLQGEIMKAHDTAMGSDGIMPYNMDMMKKLGELNKVKKAIEDETRANGKDSPNLPNLREKQQKALMKQDYSQFQIARYLSAHISAPNLSKLAKGDDYAKQEKAIIQSLQELPTFKALMEKPDAVDIVTNPENIGALGQKLIREHTARAAQQRNPARDARQPAVQQRTVQQRSVQGDSLVI